VVPAMAGLILVAPEALTVILDPKWVTATQPLIWLALYMIFSTMNTLIIQILVSQRQTKFTMRMSLINMFVMPAALAAGAHWYGTAGAAASWVLASPLTILPPAFKLVRRLNIHWNEYLRTVWPTVVSSGVMVAAVMAVGHVAAASHWRPGLRLAVESGAGAVTYAAVLLIFFREKIWRYVRFARGFRSAATEQA